MRIRSVSSLFAVTALAKSAFVVTALAVFLALQMPFVSLLAEPAHFQTDNPDPPAAPVKLIFIHHSTGGNWLADPNSDQPSGGLGIALRDNNYFVSATNYGWGPDGIGDRTDIPNWPEWFAGPDSDRFMEALFAESGQNVGDFGSWSRMARDPGGENEIVMFKSCFPNSNLYGNPDDPPAPEPGGDLTVSNAKAVYQRILTYFATRQDKLFVVITAPPLAEFEYGEDAQSPAERAANARALNNWLVNDWLAGYPYANVAVFDYYNVLTSNAGNPDANDLGQERGNHHRWRNGQIEHVQTVENDFSAYPSGDSHPSSAGHRKATAEFVPLLNVYYNRWKSAPAGALEPTPTSRQDATSTFTPTPGEAEEPTSTPAATPAPLSPAGVIVDWEGEHDWTAYNDDIGSRVVSVVDAANAHGGQASLRVEYDLVDGGWGGCEVIWPQARDWSDASGISLWLHSDAAAQPVNVVLYAGNPEAPTPFVARVETTDQAVSGWTEVALPWTGLERADWADAGGLSSLDPALVVGLGISIGSGKGTLWLDDVMLLSGEVQPREEATATATLAPTKTASAAEEATATTAPEPVEAATPETPKKSLCRSAVGLPLLAVLVVWFLRRR
jgi:Carbohydrate binding domain (family 11)